MEVFQKFFLETIIRSVGKWKSRKTVFDVVTDSDVSCANYFSVIMERADSKTQLAEGNSCTRASSQTMLQQTSYVESCSVGLICVNSLLATKKRGERRAAVKPYLDTSDLEMNNLIIDALLMHLGEQARGTKKFLNMAHMRQSAKGIGRRASLALRVWRISGKHSSHNGPSYTPQKTDRKKYASRTIREFIWPQLCISGIGVYGRVHKSP